MPLDFKKEYEQLSNEELLKIVRQADQYQREAVATAQEVLNTRDVTEEEENKVDRHFYNIEAEKQAVKDTKEAAKKAVSSKLQEVVNPFNNNDGKPKPVLWLNMFIIAWVGLYLWKLPGDIKILYYIIQADYDFVWDHFFIFLILRMFFIPLTSILLYKRSLWGWKLLSFYSIFQLGMALPIILGMIKGSHLSSGTSTQFFIGCGFYSLLVYFLFKPEITALFKVTKSIKRKVILNTLIISLIIALLLR